MVVRHAWPVVILLAVLATVTAVSGAPGDVPDVFALRLLNPEDVHGSVFRGWVQVYNPYDQRPLPGVAVRAEIEIELMDAGGEFVDGETLELEGQTDERGEWPIETEVPLGSRLAHLDVTAYASYRGVEREVFGWAVRVAEPRVILSTDKRLYQPGQTLHVRGLWLDAAGRARAAQPVALTIRDGRGRQVWRRELTTSGFGIAAADWRIPESAATGEYQVQAADGSAGVRISRYEMARFGLEVTADRSYYLPAEDAELTIAVTAVDGTPVAGAEVRLEPGGEPLLEASTTTGDAGRAVLAVDLGAAHDRLVSSRYDDDFRDLEVEVTATDPLSRRSERTTVAIRVSRQPIHVYLTGELPPVAGLLGKDAPGEGQAGGAPALLPPSRAWIATFYPDGEPAPCTVELRNREGGGVVARFATNAYGVGRLPAEPAIVDAVLEAQAPRKRGERSGLELVVRDAGGRSARSEVSPWQWEVDDEPVLAVAGRTLFRPGEPLEVTLVPSEPMGRVVVELVGSSGTLAIRELARIEGPTPVVFSDSDMPPRALAGLLRVRAYPLARPASGSWDEVPLGERSVIYPERGSLRLEVSAERETHRPGGQARLTFAVAGAAEAAIGVAIVDRGAELRQAGEGLPGPALLAGLDGRGWPEVAGWTLERLLALGPERITPALGLLAEYLLFEPYSPGLEGDTAMPFGGERRQYRDLFYRQFAAVETALKTAASARAAAFDGGPRDEISLVELLERAGVDFPGLRDPWDSPYRASVSIVGGSRNLDVTSAGRDRTWDTVDDFSAWSTGWRYFQPLGTVVDRAVARCFRETGGFLAGEVDLARELARDGIVWSEVRDPWGRPYQLRVRADGGEYRLEVRSSGPPMPPAPDAGDESVVAWTSSLDWGTERENALRAAVGSWLEAGNAFPADAGEVRAALAAASPRRGADGMSPRTGANSKETQPEAWRDPHGRPLAFEIEERAETRDRIYYPSSESAPRLETVTERYGEIRLLAAGRDGVPGTGDDRIVGRLSVLHGAGPRPGGGDPVPPAGLVLGEGQGVLAGTVVDEDGVEVPGATVSAGAFTTVTGAQGRFRLAVAPGVYRVLIALEGFTSVAYDLVHVARGSVTTLTVVLELAEITEEIVVTSEAPQVATAVGRPAPSPKATPRVRRDFPETLLWLPELTTTAAPGAGERPGGRAEVAVELADALTTWQLAALASTPDGRIAVAEAEIPVTQPLSLDPDLPPFLTAGDEVEVPVYLHNRTPRPRAVDVRMEPRPGLVLQRPLPPSVALEGDQARRLDLPLRFVDPGPAVLQLSARAMDAADAADAVERVAEVRPAGYQHATVHNALLSAGGGLDFDLDAAAVPGSARLEVTVDHGVADHLTAAIRGLARRPTGCAEQQTSTAFLSLLLLQRAQAAGRGDRPEAKRARANLEQVRDSLVHHVAGGGGFGYWPGGKADLALTAYVLDFLHQVAAFVEVDPALKDRARRWLLDRQQKGVTERPSGPTPTVRPSGALGSWPDPQAVGVGAHPLGADRLTAWVANVLSRELALSPGDEADRSADHAVIAAAVGRALDFLERRSADDPYTLAHATLAGIAAGRDVGTWIMRLRSLAREQGATVSWLLESQTPFYGWGAGGRLETTAAAVEALLAADPEDPLARRGLTFLLLSKDADGMWLSTQATARVLRTLALGLPVDAPAGSAGPTARVFLDGEPWSPEQPSRPGTSGLAPGRHRLSLDGEAAGRWALMRATVRSTVPWDRLREVVPDSRELRYDVDCGDSPAAGATIDVQVGRPVECRVEFGRTGFHGYGMLIAEIGLPPRSC